MAKHPQHLIAALGAFVIVAIAIATGVLYATHLERLYAGAVGVGVADSEVPVKDKLYRPQVNHITPDVVFYGSAFQKAALGEVDLLPVYGASEMLVEANEYQAAEFFGAYPTGFALFQVAKLGGGALDKASSVAALGNAVKGRKIVISSTPQQFFVPTTDPKAYAGLFSRLHAYALVFSPLLSIETKVIASRRMLAYPGTLVDDGLLSFSMQTLVSGSSAARVLYWLSYPLGRLQTRVLELQDHYEALAYLWSSAIPEQGPIHQGRSVDWRAELKTALAARTSASNNNQFGFDNDYWVRYGTSLEKGLIPIGDNSFRNVKDIELYMRTSAEWTDLRILLHVLDDLGAEVLLLGRPMHAPYYAATGVSNATLQEYQTTLKNIADEHHIPLVDFNEHKNNINFSVDPKSHPGPVGWVYINQALDAFYHETLQ